MPFKKTHLLDEDRVDGIFNPQPRRRDAWVHDFKIGVIF